MSHSAAEGYWKRQARLVAWKHNFATWLAAWLPVFLIASVLGSTAILILRRQELALRPAWWSLGALLALGAATVLVLRQHDFFKMADALVRLEITLQLRNRLTSALAGVGTWPAPGFPIRDRWQWQWPRMAAPLVGGAALLAAAAAIPLPVDTAGKSSPPQAQPTTWQEVQTWIDALQKEDLVEQESLENLAAQLDTLRGQDARDWYQQASLEAGDNLHAETAQALRELQENLQVAADNAAKMLAASDQSLTDADLKAINQALAGALQNLQGGKLPLNKNLLQKLQQMDPKALKALTPQQLAQLQQQLQKGSGACQACLAGEAGKMMTLQKANGQFGTGPGGGGGPAPLTAQNPTNLHTKTTSTISNDDLTRALPGEVVGLSTSEHEIDKNTSAVPVSGGRIAQPGEGGQAIWKDSLTPDETQTLCRYFK